MTPLIAAQVIEQSALIGPGERSVHDVYSLKGKTQDGSIRVVCFVRFMMTLVVPLRQHIRMPTNKETANTRLCLDTFRRPTALQREVGL